MDKKECYKFNSCEAPICPLDPSAREAIWFIDEPTCVKSPIPDWVKTQHRITRALMKLRSPSSVGYFKISMLERKPKITKSLAGITENKASYRKDDKTLEEEWLRKHHPIAPKDPISKERREKILKALEKGRRSKSGKIDTDNP